MNKRLFTMAEHELLATLKQRAYAEDPLAELSVGDLRYMLRKLLSVMQNGERIREYVPAELKCREYKSGGYHVVEAYEESVTVPKDTYE